MSFTENENNAVLKTDSQKTLIIFDTDMDTDCDDAGALALLYEYVKRGKSELLGIIADSPCEFAAPFCEVLGDYYGIKRPIGAVCAEACLSEERFFNYREHSKKAGLYNKRLSNKLNKTDKDYHSDTDMYRKLLQEAPDKSVTVVCVGLLTAAANAVMSEPDSISPLSGRELFLKKVQKVVCMSEVHKQGQNFNWDMDPLGAEVFLRECPVPVYVSTLGSDIITGKRLSEYENGHPVKEAYRLFGRENIGRSSWDLIAVLYALDGDSDLLVARECATLAYDEKNKRTLWNKNGTRKDFEIAANTSFENIEAYIEACIMGEF